MNKYYSGIGSRSTPPEILGQMTELAGQLEQMGWWLRSGAAGGADSAFQEGVKEKAQIWLPWPNFAKDIQEKYPQHQYHLVSEKDEEARNAVSVFHPNPAALSRGGFALHRRNFRQIVGLNEPNSSFVICWTEGGLKKGGTATAIRLAESLNIPVFNLFNLTIDEILDSIVYGKL